MTTTIATETATEAATHARIVNGGTPEVFTWSQVCGEAESAMSGPLRTTVKEMSAADGRYDIHYRDGRKVVIRPATDQDRAEAAEVVKLIAHAAEHDMTLKPADFGPHATLDGMDAGQWIHGLCCMDEPLPSCPGR